MPVIPLGYPLDLTATAATNFIQNEVVTFNTVQEKMFVPSKGPFYTLSMEIRHGVTNALLQPETQYKLLQPVKEAIRMSGKEVCAVIYITDNSIPSITISYRVIGGIFSDTASEIGDVLLNNPLPPSSQVSWWDILDKPDQFTPSEHLHHVDNIYGMDDVVAVLENIRIAILAGDSVAIGAIYQYINVLLSNLEYATENFVNDALSSLDTTKYVRAFNTHAELRDFSSLVNNEPYLYITTGRTAPQDKLGNIFYWDITSVEDDDDRFVLKPNHIPPGNPGRFISPLRDTHEQKKLATSVQRVLNTSTELYEDSLLINQAVVTGDCNNYVKEGKYWVGNHALIANAPFSNCVMEVTNIASLNADPSQGEVLQVFDDGLGKRARRIRQYVSPGVYQWSDLVIKDDAGVEEKFECNIGIVIRYFGQTPVLLPCYIGEDPGIDYVTVKISGEVKTLQLDNIAPVPDLVNGSHNLAYIYLVENPPGTFALARGVKPNFPSTGNMTQERKSMYHPGDNPLTSNRLFVGLAYSDGVRYRLSRSWHQDPGFIENYYNYIDRALLDNPAALGYYSGKTLPIRLNSVLRCFLGVYNSIGTVYFENDMVGGKELRAIPFISWADEAVIINFHFNAFVLNPEASFAIYLRGFVYTVTSGLGYFGTGTSTRVSNGGYTAPGDETNTYDTVNGSFIVTNKDDSVGGFQIGASGQGGATLKLLPDYSTAATITLTQVHNFRKLYITASDPSIWFGNIRIIVLTGTIFDLNLKTYHDNLYGGPAPAGTTVEFIVSPGCLVSSSSTSTYALTNPNTWASGVVIKLIVQSGGYVSGRGGDGGRGGRAYRLATDPNGWYNYIGGRASTPTSHVHGKKGGNAIQTFRALIIELSGYIGVGGGGGGASAGGIIFFNTAGNISKIASGGNSGGGGWPFGLAGQQSQITPQDDSFADYYLDTLDGYEAWHVAGNIGQSSGGISEITTLKSGGLPTTREQGGVYGATITHNAGGNGSLPFISQFSTGGGGSSWTRVVDAQIGDAGNGGNDGDYAINGIANVTLINNGGIIRGGQV